MKKIIYLFLILLFLSCAEQTDTTQVEQTSNIEGFVEGKMLYETNCAACHQKSGEPKVKIYPPLKNSDYLKANHLKLPCIIRHGIKEDLVVNGQEYKIKMQGFPNYTAKEISQISNYICNAWGNNYGITSTNEVIEQLKNCE